MPRIRRSAPEGLAHHVINRGNDRKTVFHKTGDYQAFLRFIRHQHYGTCGHGHIWQGRFKNFPIQHDVHLLRVLRYVEANAGRANLVRRAKTGAGVASRRPMMLNGQSSPPGRSDDRTTGSIM